MNKKAIFREVTRRVSADPRCAEILHPGRCLFFAIHTVKVLLEEGERAILQAGSAGWPRILPEQDNGKISTHFSYMWTPDEARSRIAVANGLLPEMHVWAAIPSRKEIVDMSTKLWPEQAQRLGGFDWPGTVPPDFFWGTADDLRSTKAFYWADADAIKHALKVIVDLSRKHPVGKYPQKEQA